MRAWEAHLYVFYVSGWNWERDLYVFYVSGRPLGGPHSNGARVPGGSAKEGLHACGEGRGGAGLSWSELDSSWSELV